MVPSCDSGPFLSVMGPLSVRGRLAVEWLEDRVYLTVRTPGEMGAFDEYLVKPGEVFVVGDDRGMSTDSRIWDEGRGAGVPIATIQGRVSRILIGEHRDGTLDFSRLFSAPGPRFHQPNVDLHLTEQRIAKCLVRPPRVTWPPPAPHS